MHDGIFLCYLVVQCNSSMILHECIQCLKQKQEESNRFPVATTQKLFIMIQCLRYILYMNLKNNQSTNLYYALYGQFTIPH